MAFDLRSFLVGLAQELSAPPRPLPIMQARAAGLYEAGTGNLVYSWDQLLGDDILEGGVVHVADGVVTTNYKYTTSEGITNTSAAILAGDLVLPDDGSIVGIGGFAFIKCSGLTNVTLPESVTSISWYAFRLCEGLVSVTIPSGVTVLDAQVFSNCTALASVALPDGITTINAAAFHTCTSLTRITIPESVTSIGNQAFGGCTALGRIEYLGTVEQWGQISLSSNWYYTIGGSLDGRVLATEVICSDGTVSI